MPRRNRKAARPRLRERSIGWKKAARDVRDVDGNVIPKWKLKPAVKPDGYCTLPSGRRKLAFNTEEKALKALNSARHNRALQGMGRVEERVYDTCKGTGPGVNIRHYHLTGQRLDQYEEVQREREEAAEA